MCGRFSLAAQAERIVTAFAVAIPEYRPHYNIAPGQNIFTVVHQGGQRQAAYLRWGFVPRWAKDLHRSMINARAETIMDKPAFRQSFQQRRCLIPADGFFEWQRQENVKLPYFITLTKSHPFAFAGIWEHRAELVSCAIITTAANAAVRPVHHRMPVMLTEASEYEQWLSPDSTHEELQRLLRPFAGDLLVYRVSTLVNSPRNDSAAVRLKISD